MNSNHILKMFRNQHYLGKIVWREQVFPGKHEAIINPELYEAVQNRLPKIMKAPRPNACKYTYLLHGLLFCHCGKALAPSGSYGRSAKYLYYRCTDDKNKKCSSAASAPKLDQAVIEVLKSAPLKKSEIRSLVQKANQERNDILDRNHPEIKNNELALNKAIKERKNIESMFLDGRILDENKDHFNRRFSELGREIKELEEKRVDIEAKAKFYKEELDFDKVMDGLKTFADVLSRTSNQETIKSFIRSRVERIVMGENKQEFTIKIRTAVGLLQEKVWWS